MSIIIVTSNISAKHWGTPSLAADTRGALVVETKILGSLLGLVFAAIGLLTAINFRGITGWNAKMGFEITKGADDSARRQQQVARHTRVSRVFGAVFAVIGVLLILLFIFGHFHPRS